MGAMGGMGAMGVMVMPKRFKKGEIMKICSFSKSAVGTMGTMPKC